TKFLHRKEISKGLVKVGDNTYGALGLVDAAHGRLEIGNFCSIADGVKFVIGNHKLDLVTTYPFKALNRFYSDSVVEEQDHYSSGTTVIGNDVWIGLNAHVMSGVRVGDGAVIAANAVVVKDVEPYSIVGGNPAKHIKFRVADPELRKKLQEIAWWNWPEELVERNINKI